MAGDISTPASHALAHRAESGRGTLYIVRPRAAEAQYRMRDSILEQREVKSIGIRCVKTW